MKKLNHLVNNPGHTAVRMIVFTLFIFIAGSGNSQSYSINPKTKQKIDSTYNAYVKKYKVVGLSIAIVDSGKIVYATGYGFSDALKQTPADANTVYRIGSITKSFTALSILQLQEKGLLDISNPISTYLPELKMQSRFKDNNPIYIKDMLSHISGLPCDITNGVYCDAPPDMNWVIGELNKQVTISPRLYKYAYSNVAYGLLGEVIARVSKSSYDEALRKNIFIPLNMSSTYLIAGENVSAGISKGYYDKKEFKDPMLREQAAGLIHSNVIDMSNYINMYLNDGTFNKQKIISAASISEMEKNQVNDVRLASSEQYGYGLDTQHAMLKSKQDSTLVNVIGHSGDTYIFHSDFRMIPELKVGVILLSNTSSNGWIVGGERLLKLYLKESRGLKSNFRYKNTEDNPANKTDPTCSDSEKKGQYNLGSFIIDVQNPKKIKFRQGPVKIKFYQKKKTPEIYTAKAFLYGIVPFKVKGQEFKFVKLDDQVYLKVLFTDSGEEDYLGIKTNALPVTESWKKMTGEYVVTGDKYPCKDCPFMNFEGMTMNLSVKNKFLVMNCKGKTKDTHSSVYLDLLSDSLAVGGGIGRGTGETVRILKNGNIYYSGFEFTRKK